MAKYVQGLNKDTGPIDQPEGTYRYAKNAILSKRVGAVVNEHGNSTHVSIGDGHIILGTIEITDGRIIVFSTTVTQPQDGLEVPGQSRITVIDNGVATIVLQTEAGAAPGGNDFDLKFNKDYPIEGTYKLDADQNLIIYWTDNYNFPRTLNVTRQLSFQSESNPFFYTILYNKHPEFLSNNTNYIDRLNLFPHAGPVPRIEFGSIANGGALKSGTYFLFLAYVDENFTQTNFVSYSLGVPVVEDDEAVRPIERYDGCPADSQTGKSIVWNVSNLNRDYEYLRPVVVVRISEEAEFAYKLNDIDISDTTTTITFSMLEGYESKSVEEVIVDTVSYETAKTLAQLDSVLYLGNLSGTKDVGYQRYANAIGLSSRVETLDPFDPYELSMDNLMYGYLDEHPDPGITKEQGFRDINNLASSTDNKRGYTRDEVYAFYIAFILNDGSMSYAYHIPGRAQLTGIDTRDIGKLGSTFSNEMENTEPSEGYSETSPVQDNKLLDITNESGQLFHFYDMSKINGAKDMNFWQNKNEVYPNTEDYLVYDGATQIGDLRGQPVRHHRMPTNWNDERSSIAGDNVNLYAIQTETVTNVYYFACGESPSENNDAWGEEAGSESPPVVIMPFSDQYVAGPDGVITEIGNPSDDWMTASQGYENFQDDNDWIFAVPDEGQQGQFVWTRGPNSLSATGHVGATIIEVNDDGIHVEQEEGDGAIGGTNPVNSNVDKIIAAYFVWAVTETVVTNARGTISHDVRPLGVKLDNIKIPQSIADKVQGFKIYYAERNHANRRVLGQDLLKNTKQDKEWDDAELSACDDQPGNGEREAFILAPGTLYENKISEAVFHDHYLLEKARSLVPSTHTTHEYSVRFISFRGPGHFYSDVNDDLTQACMQKRSHVSLHLGTEYDRASSGNPHLHFPLREKCKTYLQSDAIFDGRSLGFGKRIYNLGGESCIMLGFDTEDRNVSYNFREAGEGASWHQVPGAQSQFSYASAENNSSSKSVKMQIHNLQAFKTDMYLSFDTQELVWTGYEVLGDDINNFIVGDTGDTPDSWTGETDVIFGGDTFLCRHGYRLTHRPELGGVSPKDHKCLLYTIAESSTNINFRHETGVDTSYFPGSPAKKVLDIKAEVDLSDVDNMKYNSVYDLGVADVKPAIPFPLREADPTIFKTRIQRSAKADDTSLIDNYRVFLTLEFKDMPRNRGDIWKLVVFNNLMYIHTEDSIFKTKGKQTLQLQDGLEAFVGGGDIFQQAPDELMQTEAGYGGTVSQWVSLVCPHGYFCMDYRNKKVLLVKDRIYDIGKSGLENWFRDNIPYALVEYGLPDDFDNPIQGIGFHATWDEQFDRILLTKRDLKPTQLFIDAYTTTVNDENMVWSDSLNQFVHNKPLLDVQGNYVIKEFPVLWTDTDYFTKDGWTASFDGELNIWVSFHDYIPYIYSYTNDFIVSANEGCYDLWKHKQTFSEDYNDFGFHPGRFYGTTFPFEFEFIYNKAKDDDKVFYSFNYTLDVYSGLQGGVDGRGQVLKHRPGFTSFYVYTTHQISDEQEIEYMMNVRRIGNEWKINKFRDLANLVNSGDIVYYGDGPGHSGSNYGLTGVNVAGTITETVQVTSSNTMFNVSGMNETINNSFIDVNKSWNTQRKFSDKWVGIRLICSNSDKNLINLYATDVAAKKFYR